MLKRFTYKQSQENVIRRHLAAEIPTAGEYNKYNKKGRPEENFKPCCNWLAGETVFTAVPSRKAQRNSARLWLWHCLCSGSGLGHLTCADSRKETRKLVPVPEMSPGSSCKDVVCGPCFWAREGCWAHTLWDDQFYNNIFVKLPHSLLSTSFQLSC